MELASRSSEPAAAGRRAQLLLAMLLVAVFPAAFNHPRQQHILRLDLPLSGDAAEVPPPADAGSGVLPLTTLILPDVPPHEPRAIHHLVVTHDGRVMLDGVVLDLIGLRQRLDLIEVEREWVSFEPDPHARYELFIETFAVARRAGIERLLLPATRFAGAIDGIE